MHKLFKLSNIDAPRIVRVNGAEGFLRFEDLRLPKLGLDRG